LVITPIHPPLGDIKVLSDGATAPGMVAQRRGWHRAGGDKETRSTGLMSRCCPTRARGRHSYLFRGFRRHLSRGATWRSYGSGRHSVTELTPALPHSSRTVPGMAGQGGLAEQRRDMIPRRCPRAGVARIRLRPGRPRRARAFNALVGGVGAASRAWGSLEPSPRARRKFARGVPCRSVGGLLWFLWGCGPFHFWAVERYFWGSWHVRFAFYYFSKIGFFPVIRGPLWLS
jgi:hypothetical protein